jgi:hypothetical protein
MNDAGVQGEQKLKTLLQTPTQTVRLCLNHLLIEDLEYSMSSHCNDDEHFRKLAKDNSVNATRVTIVRECEFLAQ